MPKKCLCDGEMTKLLDSTSCVNRRSASRASLQTPYARLPDLLSSILTLLQQQPQQPQTPLIPQAAAANGVSRPPSGVPQPQMVQQIRSQVGISQQQQQQRIAAALAATNNTRMSPPQLTAAQAAHFRAMAAAQQGQGQGQASGQGPAQMQQPSAASAALSAAAPALSAAHLSPSFAARATSSSPGLPQQSPPLPAASPANAAVARPPSAVPGQSVQGVPMTPMLHAQNVAQYYMQMQQRGLTQEQLQAMVAQVSYAHDPDVRVCVLSSD